MIYRTPFVASNAVWIEKFGESKEAVYKIGTRSEWDCLFLTVEQMTDLRHCLDEVDRKAAAEIERSDQTLGPLSGQSEPPQEAQAGTARSVPQVENRAGRS
jgi:hypothetical protein